jgi:ethanolamine utilization protein EutN
MGHVVATIEHPALERRRLLLVQPHDPTGKPVGDVTMALDVVDAGTGDWVLLLDEGTSASQALATPRGPIRTLVVGVVDAVSLAGGFGAASQSQTGQGVDSPEPV